MDVRDEEAEATWDAKSDVHVEEDIRGPGSSEKSDDDDPDDLWGC